MMMAAFKPVNSPTATEARKDDLVNISPTTPRAFAASQASAMDDATTPTKATFGSGALAAQKPLPTSPFPDAVQIPEAADTMVPQRENSQTSRKSRDSDEMDMDDSDGETGAGDDGAGSDDESVNADGTRSSKKKKSQRFYCTDYPPCSLSFTRSEHLARHIRYVPSPRGAEGNRNAVADDRQETHGRAPLSVPLLPAFLPARQPPAACPNGPRQRRDTHRLAGGYRDEVPTADTNRPGSDGRRQGPVLYGWEPGRTGPRTFQVALNVEHRLGWLPVQLPG